MKICIITGASYGLGRNMCKAFQEAGFYVINLDIIIQENGFLPNNENYTYIKTDISNPAEIENAFTIITEKFGKAHILINNAAISSFEKHISDIKLNDYDSVLNTNLRGAFLCSQAFIKLNQGENYGRIINISSTRWNQNEPNWELYGMSKGGIVSLTNSLCISLANSPITVNAISPGWIHTGDISELSPADHAMHPSRRVGKPDDISRACLFLVEEENDFINGTNIVIDGGMTKKMLY